MNAALAMTRVEVLEVKHHEAQQRVVHLRRELDTAEGRVLHLRDELEDARAALPMDTRREVPQAVPAPLLAPKADESAWRTAVRTLGSFCAAELAAEVDASKVAAKAKIKDYLERGILEPDGKSGSRPMFKFIKPDQVGPAFANQQRLRLVEPAAQRVLDVSGVEGTGNNAALNALHKDVRKVVREAQAEGWRLSPSGSGHFALTKGSARVRVAGTPRNPSVHASMIRQDIKRGGSARKA